MGKMGDKGPMGKRHLGRAQCLKPEFNFFVLVEFGSSVSSFSLKGCVEANKVVGELRGPNLSKGMVSGRGH